MKKKFLCLTLAIAISMAQVVSVGAAREDQVKQEQAQTSSQLNAANAAIKNLEKKTDALKSEISALDKNLVEIMTQIGILEDEITEKETQIEDTKVQLAASEADRDTQYDAMKKRIQYLYEKGGDTAWAQLLLEAEDISSLLNKAEYTQKLYDYDRESLDKYITTVQEVTDLGNQLESDKSELIAMQDENKQQQSSLEKALEDKKSTASDYEGQISNAQEQANQYKKLLQQQTAELKKIEEEKQKAAEEAAKKAEEAKKAAAAEAAKAKETETKAAASTKNNNTNSASTNTANDSQETSKGSTTNKDTSSSDKGTSSDSSSKVPSSGNGQAVVNYATQFVGNPYVWGGTSLTNGADCSGFTMSVFAKFGVSLPHSSAAQASSGVGVSYSQAQPGDLICYSGHVAIYMGGGQIVHASNAKDGIKISGNAAYRTIVAVRRVI